MKYIIKPTRHEKNKWVIAKDNLSKEDVRRTILNSELLISDLDYSIAASPTKAVVIKGFFYNPITLLWGAVSLLRIVKAGRKNRYSIWQNYFTRFEKYLEKIVIDLEKESRRIYPGVRGFIDYLHENCPNQKSILVTRTDKKIGFPYQQILGFNEAYYRRFEKDKVIDELIIKYSPRIITIAGDSEEDKEMIDTAKKSKIEYCLGINVAKNIKRVNEEFDINIGRNWKGLQEIINGY